MPGSRATARGPDGAPRARARGWIGVCAGLLLACSPADRDDLAELREEQERLLQRIERLEAAQERGSPTVPATAPTAEDWDRVHVIETGSAPVLGKAEAPVTIVEFSDFECGLCAESAPVLREVVDRYPDEVRLVYKHFPLSFHEHARRAAAAALAAHEQKGFWEMHDRLFASSPDLDESSFPRLAAEAGLDVERFLRDYQERREEYERRIDADYAQGLAAKVRGTPTVFVNGRRVRVRTVDGISAMIDEELRRGSSS